ncbi:MAG: hypothetical protein HQ582_07130, partial [Planctomycetes bacterium]|nr:hypothetical protein [Planctomycetota bacterium]
MLQQSLEQEASKGEVASRPGVRSLADLLDGAEAGGQKHPTFPRVEVDEARAVAEGIRKVPGERLTLYTDLAPAEEVDELPAVFEQAFPQWCEYFGVDPSDHADWSLTGFLMKDREAFLRAGLVPDELPDFAHGFSWNYDLWLYEQPSAYYRRHLLLHEGTHSFMNTVLGGCGPPWYMEGTAELLGTHRWRDDRLTLRYMPKSREEVSMWGRIKIVKEAYSAEQAMRLADVIAYPPSAHRDTGPYAW